MYMKINEDFYFYPSENLTAAISNKALRNYADNFDTYSKLEGDIPIFLDTNILLGYYGMSQKEKEKLLAFIDKEKKRIILTKQVEKEFLRNRLSVIRKDFFGPLNKIADDYDKMRKEVQGTLKSFKENKKKILSQDYPSIFQKIQEIESEINVVVNNEEIVEDIQKQVEETTTDHKNIALIDKLLDKISELKTTDELLDEEVNFLREKFNHLVSKYVEQKDNVKWKYAVPGCGETKDDAIGDYVIYHEILKYMAENKTSAIFLTNDVEKGDWLQKDKNPHNHYIEQTYRLTENIVFIIHAERTLPTISFENIHSSIEDEKTSEQNDTETLESTIISLDTEKGFGFIYTKDENLFFSYNDFNGNFRELEKNDVVKFEVTTNFNGEPKATNVTKIKYDFESKDQKIFTSEISHINHYRGIGFVSNQPENLYFHQAFLEDSKEFESMEVGTLVEYIVGFNDENEKIVRKIRIKKDQPTTAHNKNGEFIAETRVLCIFRK